jgi:Fic family protein
LYCETDDFDLTYFLVYKARIISLARLELRNYLRAKQEEMLGARELFKADHELNHRQQALVMHAVRHPDSLYTIDSHARSNGVAYATARSDLLDLASRGYFSHRRSGKQHVFAAGERLRKLRKRTQLRVHSRL